MQITDQTTYRVFRNADYPEMRKEGDTSYGIELRGYYGTVWKYSDDLLTVYTTGCRTAKRLKATQGFNIFQDCGPVEWTFNFKADIDHLSTVDKIIKLKRKKRLSPEARDKAVQNLKQARTVRRMKT